MSGCVEGPVVGANVTLDDDDDGEVSAKTDFSEIPLKDVVIVMFMLILWLYSIMLMLRAWAKIHNLPDYTTNIPIRMWSFVMEYLQRKRKGLVDELALGRKDTQERSKGSDDAEQSSIKSTHNQDDHEQPSEVCFEDERGESRGSSKLRNQSNSDDPRPSDESHGQGQTEGDGEQRAPQAPRPQVDEDEDACEMLEMIDSKVVERLASDEVVHYWFQREQGVKYETDM